MSAAESSAATYLGGGTAVAGYPGHRRSVDLDWFAAQRVENPLALSQELPPCGVDLRMLSVPRGTLLGAVSGVRVSFFELRWIKGL